MTNRLQSIKNIGKGTQNSRGSLVIIIVASLLVGLTTAIQYWYAKQGIEDDVELHAQSELHVKSLKIQNVMNEVEVAVREMAWAVERDLGNPDSIVNITKRLLVNNSNIVGSAVAFVPDYYKSKGHQFAPYSYRIKDGIRSKQLGSKDYDYHNMEWYTAPMKTLLGHWSEPYYDRGGGEMMMSTYSLPILDARGNAVAVLTADVSLDWLSAIINTGNRASLSFVISRTGKIMACPDKSLVMHGNIQQRAAKMKDTMASHVSSQMIAGRTGQASVTGSNGEDYYVFFSPVNLANDSVTVGLNLDDDSGWSMAVAYSESDIFHKLRATNAKLSLLMLLGLAMLAFIVYRTVQNITRLSNISAEKERIGGELRVASNIQHGMVPQKFPPFPERDDIDIYGTLVSAKEVGGDLYDFYIRDEKLFFCIGDVSGKGIPASLMMAMTCSVFRTTSAHETMPDSIMEAMNSMLTETNKANLFVTFFIGVLDLPTGRLRYSNAGHCPPLIVNNIGEQEVTLLPVEPNIPLGLMAEWRYTMQETRLSPSSTIFLYTDGLTEAEADGHIQFGTDRMLGVARGTGREEGLSPKNFISRMSQAVERFVNGAEQSDDLTMLAVQYMKPARQVRLMRNITLKNKIEAVPELADFVNGVCAELSIDEVAAAQLNLAMEEAVVNIIRYAYPTGTEADIDIEAEADDVRLRFTISDSGIPFDPTIHKKADTTLSVEERPIGGLGIHLIRKIMDSVNYEYADGKNFLTLIKKL